MNATFFKIITLFIIVIFVSRITNATGGKITIASPINNAVFSTKDSIKIIYDAIPEKSDEHLHLNIDGKMVEILNNLKGAAAVAPLSPGKHRICLAINSKRHIPTGVQECVNIINE